VEPLFVYLYFLRHRGINKQNKIFGTFNVKANLMITIMLALMTEYCIL